MMAQHSLPIHTKSNPYIPSIVSAHLAFSRELNLFRQPTFLYRNLRTFLQHHDSARRKLSNQASERPSERRSATANKSQDDQTRPTAVPAPLSNGENPVEKALTDAVSKETLVVKTMDPDFSASARRSVRHLTHRVFDDDEAELTLAPISIRKKINFVKNRPSEEERPRKRIRTDRTVQRTKCHCSLTIWDNRDGLEEAAAALVEKHVSCMATWSHSERFGHVVDIDTDKPFKVRAGDLKVPIRRHNESTIGVSENYFCEFKIWPTKEGTDWPPIPLLGKSDGDVNRPNRSAHTVLSGSLVAKYNNLPKQTDADTPLSVFYLDESGAMLRTKYGLEVLGEWAASKIKHSPGPMNNGLAWAVDDEDNFLGRKKRPRAESSPKTPPRPRKQVKQTTRTKSKEPLVQYYWEPDPSNAHLTRDEFQTTEFEGLGCPACPLYEAQDLWELRFHFLSGHSRFNFILNQQEYNDTSGELVSAQFRVSSTQPSKRRLDSSKELGFLAPSTPFDLAAYLGGDTSWTGETPVKVSRQRLRPPVRFEHSGSSAAAVKLVGFKEDPLVALRAKNHGHLPPQHVPEFRRSSRQKHKPISLIRHTDNKQQAYESVSHRPVYPEEDAMSESDDERDHEWYIQRHLEILDVDADEYNRKNMKQELFRRWDRHRLEERSDHVEFLSESLVRFVNKNRKWLRSKEPSLNAAFGSFTSNLLCDKLINSQVYRDLHALIWQDTTPSSSTIPAVETNGVPTTNGIAQSASSNSLTTSPSPEPPTKSTEILPPHDNAPAAIAIWRQKVLTCPPYHCGICTEALTPTITTVVTCVARSCATPSATFHPRCVGLAAKRMGWVCFGCRIEAKERRKEEEQRARVEVGKDEEMTKGDEKRMNGNDEQPPKVAEMQTYFQAKRKGKERAG